MRDFLQAVWGDLDGRYGELRLIGRSADRVGGGVVQRWATSPEEAEQMAHAYPFMDVYFGVLPRLRQSGGGDAIADETFVLWADYDAKSYDDEVDDPKTQAFLAMRSVAPEPQIVVDSGNGYHAYWLLRRPAPFDEARQVMRGIAKETGADNVADKARILRVPGTLNHKSDPPHPVRILRFDVLSRWHRIQDFVDYASAVMPARAPRDPQAWGPGEDYETRDGKWELSSEKAPKFGEGQRNNGLTSLAGIMFARGMNDDEVLAALEWENSVRCDPPLVQREVEQIVRSVSRYAR